MNGQEQKAVVGFVGTGVMGGSMAGHLLDAGFIVHLYTRSREKAEELVSRGALWENSVKALAASCDVVVTMVGYPRDVEEVYFGPEGLIENARPGACLIDMTTSSPSLAARIEREASLRGVRTLDAPVSGGDVGARNATLSIMVGGEKETFDAMLPLLGRLGKNIVHQGRAGSGQHAKMANQIAIAGNMLGVCEALAYAKGAGLDPETVLASIGGGAAASWSLSNLAPRMLAGNFEPGFFVKHFIKDMEIAVAEAGQMGLDAPGLRLALDQYRCLAEEGGAECGTQALFKLYDFTE